MQETWDFSDKADKLFDPSMGGVANSESADV
jgi:hypothetical protein